MQAWLLADKQAPPPSYFTEEVSTAHLVYDCYIFLMHFVSQDKKRFTDIVKRDGIASALNWYKSYIRGIGTEDKGTSSHCAPVYMPWRAV